VLLFTFIGQFYGLNGVAIGVSLAIILNYLLMTTFAIKLTQIKWIRLIESHLGGLIIGIVLFPVIFFIQDYINNFLLELALAIIIFLFVNIILIKISPRLFIGTEGANLIKKLK